MVHGSTAVAASVAWDEPKASQSVPRRPKAPRLRRPLRDAPRDDPLDPNHCIWFMGAKSYLKWTCDHQRLRILSHLAPIRNISKMSLSNETKSTKVEEYGFNFLPSFRRFFSVFFSFFAFFYLFITVVWYHRSVKFYSSRQIRYRVSFLLISSTILTRHTILLLWTSNK